MRGMSWVTASFRPRGQQESQRTGGQGEDDVLGHQQAGDPAFARAQHNPHRHLRLPGRGPHQHQRCDVGDREQQHQKHRAGKDPDLPVGPPTMRSRSGIGVSFATLSLKSLQSGRIRALIPARSAAAISMVTPSLSRPMPRIQKGPGGPVPGA